MPEFTGHRDLRAYLRVFWRWKWLFLAFVVAAPLVAFVIESGKPKTYRSSALVGVNQTTVNGALLQGGGSFSTSNVTAIAQLVTTTPVATAAAALLHPPGNPSQIAGEVSASGDPNTNFLTITAEDRSSVRAAQIANAFARAISLNRQQAAISEINTAITGVVAQLSHLSRSDNVTRPALKQQLAQLRAARATQGSNAAILQAAAPSATPAGPLTRRSVELALVIGIVLGFGAIALAENADRRLRTPDDLEGMTDLPLLAAIAPSAFSSKLKTSKEDDEAFHTLHTALMYFNVDRQVKSIVVTSPGEKDGKTTVATRLALVAAGSGHHVTLVDADLRRAQVSVKLGLHAQAGLGEVLLNQTSATEALVDYPVQEPGAGRLTVLPAGPPPPNPTALLSSDQMQRVLFELESHADLVIIDTPAALAVSDAIPLMRSVTGVVLVARMNRSSREKIRRLQRIIQAAHGTVLGVIATGVESGPGYDGYTSKYYTQNGTNGSRRARWPLGSAKQAAADEAAVIAPPDQRAGPGADA